MRSIRIKMVIMYLIMVFIVMAAVGTFTIVQLTLNEESKAREQLSDSADMIRDEIVAMWPEEDFQEELMKLTRPGA